MLQRYDKTVSLVKDSKLYVLQYLSIAIPQVIECIDIKIYYYFYLHQEQVMFLLAFVCLSVFLLILCMLTVEVKIKKYIKKNEFRH